MGYRSDIIIALDKAQYDRDLLITRKVPSLLIGEENRVTIHPNHADSIIAFKFSFVKWRQHYPDVAEVTAYLNYLENLATEHEDDLPKHSAHFYGYLEIGEHLDDITLTGDPDYFGLSARTEYSFDFEVEESKAEAHP